MTPISDWERLTRLFEEALSIEEPERSAWLERLAGQSPSEAEELEGMLAAHHRPAPFRIEEALVGERRANHPTLPAGTRIGAYRIEGFIRAGGMGEVYRGERDSGDYRQTVAIKVLRSGLGSEELVHRFRRERQILAGLTHPDIVPILDGGATFDGRPYLVMPFVDGQPITDYCRSRGLSVHERAGLVRRVAQAVQYAHARLVVHRDLKPSNILVTPTGDPRLLDFGIAKLLGTDPEEPGLPTGSGLPLLTPAYAAPEQLLAEEVTTATDVYALGLLLYEVLTGTRPRGREPKSLVELHRTLDRDPAPPSSVTANPEARKIRGDLDRIVLMALRREPERRYPSAGELAEDLDHYLAHRPVRAERDTAWYRIQKFSRRNPVLVGAAAILLMFGLGWTITTAIQSRRIGRALRSAERESQTAESVIGVLTTLFEHANPALQPGGDTLRIAQLLEEGERRVDSLTAQPAVQARMWRVLGNMHAARGRYPRADTLLRRSYLLQAGLPPDERDELAAAWTYHELARLVLWEHGQAAALPLFDTSLVRLTRLLGEGHPSLSEVRLDVASSTPDLERRRALLDQVVEEQRSHPGIDSLTLARTLNADGEERFARGKGAEAASLFEASLRILDRVLPKDHPERRTALHNLSAALGRSGDWRRSEPLALEAVELHRKATAPDSAALGNAIENLAVTWAYIGKLEQSESALREVLTIFRRVLPAEHWHITSTLRNIALVAAQRGHTAEGLTLLDSVLTRSRAASGEQSEDWAYYSGQRVPLLIRAGRTSEAIAVAYQADRIIRALTPPTHRRRADADMWVGEAAFARGDAMTAATRFDSARVRLIPLLPATDVRRAAAECGHGIALAMLGQRAGALAELRSACVVYRNAAFADSVLLEWARRATASLEGR